MRLANCLFVLFFFIQLVSFSQENEFLTVSTISISGNKTTKEYIILRELTIDKGDTVHLSSIDKHLERSKENIFNTRLFNFVTVTKKVHDKFVDIDISVKERWYIWPFPILENADRNFNNWWREKDLSRLSYGLHLDWNNFRGRNEKLIFKAKRGFEQAFILAYAIPYIDRKKRFGFSFISNYTTNKEVNYGSFDNKRLFVKSNDKELRESYSLSGIITFRRRLDRTHRFSLNYNTVTVSDTLRKVSDQYLFENRASCQYFGLGYTFRWDRRDNISYPLKGRLFLVHAFKTGLGLTEDKVNLLTARILFKNHLKFNDRFFFAHAIIGKLNLLEKPPYFHQRGLGYTDFLRGYELNIMDAQQYGLLKQNFKVALLKPRVKKLKFLKIEKFNTIPYAIYMNIFSDFGYTEDLIQKTKNSLSNKFIMGYGVGIDYVTYYDIVIRTEYSINIENESGFFLHFKKSI